MNYPLDTANYVLIFVGALLLGLGPYVVYRTIRGVVMHRKLDPHAK